MSRRDLLDMAIVCCASGAATDYMCRITHTDSYGIVYAVYAAGFIIMAAVIGER